MILFETPSNLCYKNSKAPRLPAKKDQGALCCCAGQRQLETEVCPAANAFYPEVSGFYTQNDFFIHHPQSPYGDSAQRNKNLQEQNLMGIIMDILKEIPLSAVLREKLLALEQEHSLCKENVRTLEAENKSLKIQIRNLQTEIRDIKRAYENKNEPPDDWGDVNPV